MAELGAVRLYRDRRHAGAVLARALREEALAGDALVLALPRGGVIVGAEIARARRAPLDVLVVRKLGVPGQEELAMGAIASGGVTVRNEEVAALVREDVLHAVAKRELRELERREELYRAGRPPLDVSGMTVILADDGLATGATMRAAIAAVRAHGAARAVVAVPVAPSKTVDALRAEADAVVCPSTPEMFFGIGQFYDDFAQTEDEEVQQILASWAGGDAYGDGDEARP